VALLHPHSADRRQPHSGAESAPATVPKYIPGTIESAQMDRTSFEPYPTVVDRPLSTPAAVFNSRLSTLQRCALIPLLPRSTADHRLVARWRLLSQSVCPVSFRCPPPAHLWLLPPRRGPEPGVLGRWSSRFQFRDSRRKRVDAKFRPRLRRTVQGSGSVQSATPDSCGLNTSSDTLNPSTQMKNVSRFLWTF